MTSVRGGRRVTRFPTNDCVFSDDGAGVWLYHTDCLSFMDELAGGCPDGVSMRYSPVPPYFLSNGGIICLDFK